MNTNDLYCRLCADLKPSSFLTNMGINTEKRQDIVSKLTRFNIHLDFNNMLPKTVCLECIHSLERAYDFVTTVDLAQEAFEDYDSSALDIKNDDVASDDSMSFKTEDTIPDSESEVGKEIEIEYNPKTKLTITTSKSISKKRAGISNTEMPKTPGHTQRKKPKISTNVDLDTWLDYNWLCAYCDRCFQNPSELKVHSMQYHSTCNPYRCFDCRARGIHIDNFLMHISKHRPVLTLTCYKCSLKFETVKEMKTHKATHFDTEHICSGCNTSFSNQEELDEHTTAFYKDAAACSLPVEENDSLKCVMCRKISKSRLLLNRHLLLHTERKRTHICDTCGASFYNRKELVQHQIVHTHERPYKCEVCKFTFKAKNELKKHALVHFGPKRFACEQCGKCFRLNKELAVHSAVHKDIRPFKCTECSKSFRFRHLLMQHLRLHTGVKPYSCDNCPLTFRNWSNFNKHSKDVHGTDHSKRKRTSEGLYALDPETNEVIYPDKEKVLEWKEKILSSKKKGRPRKDAGISKTKLKSVPEQDDQGSDEE